VASKLSSVSDNLNISISSITDVVVIFKMTSAARQSFYEQAIGTCTTKGDSKGIKYHLKQM